jgi:hypothetical protein
VAAGHALFAIGTPDALEVLQQGIDDEDNFPRFLALKVGFVKDQPAWNSLSWLFTPERLAVPRGRVVAYEALVQLSPSSYSNDGPGWTIEPLRTLLAEDSQWLDLCVSLRGHPSLGRPARDALKAAGRSVTTPALDRAAAAAPPAAPRPGRAAPTDLLSRYERGDHVAVWQELRAAGDLVGDLRAIALEVSEETMRRVRRNFEALATALADAGWPVTRAEALTRPPRNVAPRLAEMEALVGVPVPPALQGFWRIVGGIGLVSRDEEPPEHVPYRLMFLDPIEIADAESVWFAVEEWQEERVEHHPELAGPIEMPISADYLHKADISGGDAYSVWFPDASADPFVHDESHRLYFTDYLRLAVANRGFLRLHDEEDNAEAKAWLAQLRLDFEPF